MNETVNKVEHQQNRFGFATFTHISETENEKETIRKKRGLEEKVNMMRYEDMIVMPKFFFVLTGCAVFL